jgi:hypothetical protein
MSDTEADVSRVSAALQPLQDGFAADGASLVVEGDGEGVRVRLSLTDESCAECIVGPDILRSIVTEQVRGAGVVAPLTVVDPRE